MQPTTRIRPSRSIAPLRSRKAQIQMMETIAILFIFFILVGLGFITYSQIAKNKILQKAEEFQELSGIQVAQLASSLPELQCSEQNIIRENCIDWLKAQAAPSVLSDDSYFDLFGYAVLRLKRVFPSPQETLLYSRPLPDFRTRQVNYFPIALYDPLADSTTFGVLEVEVYS